MLFPLERPGVMRMWMKDTLIPLDMRLTAPLETSPSRTGTPGASVIAGPV